MACLLGPPLRETRICSIRPHSEESLGERLSGRMVCTEHTLVCRQRYHTSKRSPARRVGEGIAKRSLSSPSSDFPERCRSLEPNRGKNRQVHCRGLPSPLGEDPSAEKQAWLIDIAVSLKRHRPADNGFDHA